METYSGFLIMSNLRCYTDNAGKLEPKFVTTEFKTIDEAKARIDKYNKEWIQWQARRQVNYAKSMTKLVQSDEDGREQDAEDFAARVGAYYEQDLLNQENL